MTPGFSGDACPPIQGKLTSNRAFDDAGSGRQDRLDGWWRRLRHDERRCRRLGQLDDLDTNTTPWTGGSSIDTRRSGNWRGCWNGQRHARVDGRRGADAPCETRLHRDGLSDGQGAGAGSSRNTGGSTDDRWSGGCGGAECDGCRRVVDDGGSDVGRGHGDGRQHGGRLQNRHWVRETAFGDDLDDVSHKPPLAHHGLCHLVTSVGGDCGLRCRQEPEQREGS